MCDEELTIRELAKLCYEGKISVAKYIEILETQMGKEEFWKLNDKLMRKWMDSVFDFKND